MTASSARGPASALSPSQAFECECGSLAHAVMSTLKRSLFLVLIAVTMSLGLRMIFISESRYFPDFRTPPPGMDVDLHWNSGRLLRQHPIAEPAFELRTLSAPANATFLSLTQRILGEDFVAHRLLYAGIGSLVTVLIFGFAFRLSGRLSVALSAALLVGIQPTWIYLSTLPIKSVFTVSLGVSLIWTAFEATRARRTRTAVLMAVISFHIGGLLFLTQKNTVFMWGATTAFVLVGGRPYGRRRTILAVTLAVCLLSATVWVVAGPHLPNPLPTPVGIPQSGIHARVGFHPGASGYYRGIRGIPPTPIGHAFIARMAAEIEVGRPLTFAEANSHHLTAALDFIRNNPSAAARLTGRKILLFFNDYAPNENYYLEELRSRSRLLATIPIGFGVLVFSAGLGVIALVRRSQWDLLFLLVGATGGVLAANVATFVTSRYRLSAMVPLAVLGAIGLWFAVDRIRGWRTGGIPGRTVFKDVLAPGLAAILVAFAPVVSNDERESALRTAKTNLQRSEEAEPLVRRLSTINSSPALPASKLKERAFLLLRLQRLTEAFQELEAVFAVTPNDPQVLRQLLAMTVVEGDYEKALSISRRCRRRLRWSDADFLKGQEESVRAILRRFILPRLCVLTLQLPAASCSSLGTRDAGS